MDKHKQLVHNRYLDTRFQASVKQIISMFLSLYNFFDTVKSLLLHAFLEIVKVREASFMFMVKFRKF